jgi:hypothetical protein
MNALSAAPGLLGLVAAPDPSQVKPGWLALVIVLLMGLATFLLWRSMNHQLKKVDFDDGSRAPSPGDAEPENGDQGPA